MMEQQGESSPVRSGENYFEQLEEVNSKLVQLVKMLIDRIKGPEEEEYEYQYGKGWTAEKHNSMKEELEVQDPEKQLEAVKKLLRNYKVKKE